MVFFPVALFSATNPADPLDRLKIQDGAVLTGRIMAVEGESIRVQTDYAGEILVVMDKIVSIEMGIPRDILFPEDLMVITGQTADMHAKVPEPPPVETKPAAPESKPPPAPEPERKRWSIDSGLNLVGVQGNTERFDITLNLNAKNERTYDRTDLYGRYTYGSNNNLRSANEIVLGGRYTNFFFKGLGAFGRQELVHDQFRGIELRSTTAAGLSYKIRERPTLKVETRAGFSYRYEIYEDESKEDQDFPGMDFGLDINWRFVEWANFKGSYTFVPSIEDREAFIIEQDTGINLPLDKELLWSFQMGVVSKYDNKPNPGREKLDLRYYARFIKTWD